MLSRHDWLILLIILGAGAWARLSHLGQIGVRSVDEGSYCFFAISMLNGDRACIQDKPGQVLLVAAGFAVFGISQYAACLPAAFLGIATVPACFWLGLLAGGKRAGFAMASCAAFLPYLLYYSRSAASDSNLFFFCMFGLCFFYQGAGASLPHRFSLRWLFVSGLVFGLGATVNLASVPPYAITWAFLALLGIWKKVEKKNLALALVVFSGGGALGVLLVEAPFAYFIDFGKVFSQVSGHAGHILAMKLKWDWAIHLWRFFGPAALLLVIGAALSFRKWWRTPAALFPILSAVLILFYARAALSLPRLHLPILLGLLPLAGLGAERLFEHVNKRWQTGRRWGHVFIAVFFLALLLPRAVAITELKSGYPDACYWLAENMREEDRGVAPHTWWTFMSFTGRTFSYGSDYLADALKREEWEQALTGQLIEFQRLGYSHLVADYLLYNRLNTSAAGNFQELVEKYRPESVGGVSVPNPVAGDYETWAEDERLPDLSNVKAARFIYIYPVRALLDALGKAPR